MMIEIDQVSFKYSSGKQALSDVSFAVSEGECVGVIGANGAGKTTLLKLLVGLETAFEGRIIVDGLEVNKKNIRDVRARIGYVFQDSDSQLFMPTVGEDAAFAPRNYGFPKEKVAKLTQRALQLTGIEDLRDRPVSQLSGGQKRLASLATVLSMEPKVLLFDEPTIALDPRNRRRVMNVMQALPGTKLIVSHDLDLVYDICDRVLLMDEGRLVEDGNVSLLEKEELLLSHGLELPLMLQGPDRTSGV